MELRRSNQIRSSPTFFTSDFGPSSKWKDSVVGGIVQVLEGARFQEHDLAEIMWLLSMLDKESSFFRP